MHPSPSLLRCAAAGALALSLLSSAAPAAASAQQTSGTIDSLARAFRAEHPTPALVIGVVDSEGERVIPYGVVGDDSTPATGDTRFEVGSVTKIFTSLLLAQMVESGDVRLDDPIARYLPDSVKAPGYRGREITLRELATHSSGLPRLPTNIAPANMADPYADYTATRLHDFLDSYELPRAPDSSYEYSNLGAGLLGYLLARHAGKPFADLLEEKILQPLGMDDSYVAELGFHASPQLALALGWHVVQLPDSSSLYWHNGGTAGARSFVGFVPDSGAGVVVLINEALPLDAVMRFGVNLARAALVKRGPGSAAGSSPAR